MWWGGPVVSASAQGYVSAQASPPGLDLGLDLATSALAAQTQKEAFPVIFRKALDPKAQMGPAPNSPRVPSTFSVLPESNEKD